MHVWRKGIAIAQVYTSADERARLDAIDALRTFHFFVSESALRRFFLSTITRPADGSEGAERKRKVQRVAAPPGGQTMWRNGRQTCSRLTIIQASTRELDIIVHFTELLAREIYGMALGRNNLGCSPLAQSRTPALGRYWLAFID